MGSDEKSKVTKSGYFFFKYHYIYILLLFFFTMHNHLTKKNKKNHKKTVKNTLNSLFALLFRKNLSYCVKIEIMSVLRTHTVYDIIHTYTRHTSY